jgi:hypothetical protein
MHTKLFLLIFILSFHFGIFSQNISITESEHDFNFGSISLHKVFGHDDGFFYVVKFHSNQYYIEKLDKNLNTVKTSVIKLHEGLKTYDLENIVHFHDEIYVFSSRRRFDDNILYYHKIDKETLKASTDFIKLAQIDFIKGNWADFHFALSRRETKLLIACRIKLNLSKVQFNEYYVFDKDMEPVWQKKDMIEFKGQGPRDNKYIVDEEGNISILSLIRRSNIFDLFRSEKNIYTIYRYSNFGETYREYSVTFPERYIRGIKISGDDNGNLICAGMYSELYRSGVRGTFYFRIDRETGMIFDSHFHPFEDQLIADLLIEKEPLLADEELLSYVMTDLIIRNDKKTILIAEQVFAQSYNTYNNLIITCFDATGQVYWTKTIPKKQDFDIRYLQNIEVDPEDYRDYVIETGSIDMVIENYCSYALLAPLDKSGIVIFYNDNIKNLSNQGKMKSFSSPRKSYIAAVTIDEYGNMNKQTLHKWRKKSLFPEPLRYYFNLNETVVIPAFKGRKYNYYKITSNL